MNDDDKSIPKDTSTAKLREASAEDAENTSPEATEATSGKSGDKPARKKTPKRQQVFTLLVEVGRKAEDGLPEGSTGAALMCYASGIDEAEAVRETVAVLKLADLAPLDVSGYGTLEERLAEGHDIPDEERVLMDRALSENAVIVAQMTPFYETPEGGKQRPN
tara:strand:+ start:33221 stop:33709 length:489 start_codon:yes stop_codon:yes gene_type:complete